MADAPPPNPHHEFLPTPLASPSVGEPRPELPPPSHLPSAPPPPDPPPAPSTDSAHLFELKGALLTAAGGMIAAAVTLLGISSQREPPLAHTGFLVWTLILASASIATVLIALASTGASSASTQLLRRLSLAACILASVPLLTFAALNFRDKPAEPAPPLMVFGRDLNAPAALPYAEPAPPDTDLLALLSTLQTNTPGPDGYPIYIEELQRSRSLLTSVVRQVVEPVMRTRREGESTAIRETEVAYRLVQQLLPVRDKIQAMHTAHKYSTLYTDPYGSPELDDFRQWVVNREGMAPRWQTDDQASYETVFFEYLMDICMRFLLWWETDPQTQEELPGTGMEAWEQNFDYWYFSRWVYWSGPPPADSMEPELMEPGAQLPPPASEPRDVPPVSVE